MTLAVVWFVLLCVMFTAYAVLDGFDLGVGAIYALVAKTEAERRQVRASIGPVWNGNEVWLLAAGGSMFMVFPRLYAASISGFYLAFMLVLWLLIGRGVGIEFRHAQRDPLWTSAWDFVFSASSILLAILFGVAVGNVLRGVPLGASGQFQGSFGLMLNWFALLGGVLSLLTLGMHGAAFLAVKTEGDLAARARRLAFWLWLASFIAAAAFVFASFVARPGFATNFQKAPALALFPLLALAAYGAIPAFLKARKDLGAFAATSAVIASLLASTAAGLFPRLLPSFGATPQYDLTIYNCATSHHGLETALIMNLIGFITVPAYTYYVYKLWAGKSTDSHY